VSVGFGAGGARGAGGAEAGGRSTSPLRVAVVGLGWAGRSIWLPRLREHPDYVTVAAVDPDPAARAAVAGVAGEDPAMAMPVFSQVDDLDAAEVDLAVVAVPNHRHCTVASGLLLAGISVFLEKPVCLSQAEADELAIAEQVGGSMLLAGSAARYRADVRSLYELVEVLGEVRHIDVAWVRARGVPDAGGWFTQREMSGGGALVDLGWHLLDSIVPMLGVVEFDQVVGTTSDDFISNASWGAAWRSDAPSAPDPGSMIVAGGGVVGRGVGRGVGRVYGDVEDTARGFLVTGDGVSVSLRARWASHEARDTTVIEVDGTAGTAALRCTFGFSPNRQDHSTLTHTRVGDTVAVPVPDEPVGAEYRRQLDELPALLADPANRGRAIDEARPTIVAIERFYASARRRRRQAAEVPMSRVGR
jgi:oxidoreductase